MKWLLRLLWLVFCFGLLEFGAKAWLFEHGDALDKTRSILLADSWFGWRQRPNLQTEFAGQLLTTNAQGWRTRELQELGEEAEKVLVLGPSSTFGWGVSSERTYAAELEKLLKLRGGRPWRVVNAGEIGFSSFQGLRLIQSDAVKRLRPAWVLIAYGVNDLDRHRFYFQSERSDSAELAQAKAPAQLWLFQAAGQSALLSSLLKLANALRAGLPVSAGVDPSYQPPLRVKPEEFVKNLRELIRSARSQGAKAALLGTPANLPSFSVTVKEAEQAFTTGEKLFRSGRFLEAEKNFLECLRYEPDRNEAFYYLEAIHRWLGNREQARIFAEQARASEPKRIHRDIVLYNGLMRRLAAEEEVPFVDLYSIFPIAERSLFFVDPIHPSAQGHAVIGQEIWRSLFKEQK